MEKARALFKEATEVAPSNKTVWQAAIAAEASLPAVKEGERLERVEGLVAEALRKTKEDGSLALSLADREELSSTLVEVRESCADGCCY